MASVYLDTGSLESYSQFLAIKQLPSWSISGRVATFPDEYADRIGVSIRKSRAANYDPVAGLFDYQEAISRIAIQKRKYAVFADCGLGKTLILLEFARHASAKLRRQKRGFLIVSPLMVIPQTLAELRKWYPGWDAEQIPANRLQDWLDNCSGKLGVTNYEAITDGLRRGQLGGMALDESSMLKSHYGKWGTRLIGLGRGLEWKACFTGTPAPNDRIEYANHAVFLDQFPTVNSFLATYFVNRGQTSERWALKEHALEQFYRRLSHWCIFLTNPATYGWKDNTESIPPIKTHIHRVGLTSEQRQLFSKHTSQLFSTNAGGISKRSTIAQLAKGKFKGRKVHSQKPEFIRDLCGQWDDSTIVWCRYNDEQDGLARAMEGDAESISGSTKLERRLELIEALKSGQLKTLISKPKILGFGLNLQKVTRQVFSTLQDSYEEYYQAVKRSNRIGSTEPLQVHIPITELEEPMAQNVLRKADMIQRDTAEQERIFKACRF